MRHVAACAVLLALQATACRAADDPAVTVCEAQLRSFLVSPGTYHRLKSTVAPGLVELDYDAVNSPKGRERNSWTCLFEQERDVVLMADDSMAGHYEACSSVDASAKPTDLCASKQREQAELIGPMKPYLNGQDYPIKAASTAARPK